MQLVQERTGRDVVALLRELYVEKRHTDREIAEALGLERATVQLWREKFGISSDDRPPVAA